MAVHKWRKRPTKFFGEVWVPFAHIDLLANDNRWHSFAVQVDSGAVVSLLRRSVADLLGLELESGRRVELGSVGGSHTEAYVHHMQTRFDKNITLDVPFAIATTERVPNLLGRLNVFDPLQIDFDGATHETRLSVPWLDEGDRRIYEALLEVNNHVMTRWNDLGLEEPLKEAARRLMQRNAQLLAAAFGLLKLHLAYEAPLILRSMFEISAQFEYLMHDPAARLQRAQQYLDFSHFTRHKLSKTIAKNPRGPIGKSFASSRLKAEGEQRNIKEYDLVRSQFQKPKGGDWSNWYCMTIRDLTEKIGWGDEYKHIYAIGSAWAHGDSFFAGQAAGFGPGSAKILLLASCSYYARMLLRISDKIVLTSKQHKLLTALQKRFE